MYRRVIKKDILIGEKTYFFQIDFNKFIIYVVMSL